MHKRIRAVMWAVAIVASVGSAGCSSSPACLELIAVARSGLDQAEVARQQHQQDLADTLSTQVQRLDAAFDADIRLAEAGAIKDARGQPISLTAAWVTSARKGYAAARDELARQQAQVIQAGAVEQDNLQASQEALDMAAMLITQQSGLTSEIKTALMAAYGRLSHD